MEIEHPFTPGLAVHTSPRHAQETGVTENFTAAVTATLPHHVPETTLRPVELERQDSNASDAQTLVEKEGMPYMFPDALRGTVDPETLQETEASRQWRRKRLVLIGMAFAVLVGTAIAIGVMVHKSDTAKAEEVRHRH